MTTLTEKEHEAVSLLLPWYATGALNAADRARVERALAADPALRIELQLVREDREAGRALADEEPIPASMSARFDALLTQEISSVRPTASSPRSATLLDRLAAFLAPPQRVAWAMTAAAIIIAVQAGAIFTLLGDRQEEPGFSTASGPEGAAGAAVLVRFLPDRTAAEIDAWLASNKARIVDGPLPGGLYRLRFQDTPDEEAAALAKRLSGTSGMFALVLPAR